MMADRVDTSPVGNRILYHVLSLSTHRALHLFACLPRQAAESGSLALWTTNLLSLPSDPFKGDTIAPCFGDLEAAIGSVGGTSNATLIKRVYEVDPLNCPECGGQMKVVSFIDPPQADVIDQILRHCGLWQSATLRAPPDAEDLVLELDAAHAGNSIDSRNQTESSQELTYVDIDTFLAHF
jgi:hypothetical protein